MNNELTALRNDIRQDSRRPASLEPAPSPVPAPRDPVDSANLQVDLASTAPLLVRVSGEIDIASAPRLRQELTDAMRRHGARLALDLSGVTFMDCAGINVLLAVRRHARLKEGWARVARASRGVRQVLTITGLHQEFGLAGTEAAQAA